MEVNTASVSIQSSSHSLIPALSVYHTSAMCQVHALLPRTWGDSVSAQMDVAQRKSRQLKFRLERPWTDGLRNHICRCRNKRKYGHPSESTGGCSMLGGVLGRQENQLMSNHSHHLGSILSFIPQGCALSWHQYTWRQGLPFSWASLFSATWQWIMDVLLVALKWARDVRVWDGYSRSICHDLEQISAW